MATDSAVAGPLTSLDSELDALDGVGREPVEICGPVHALVIQPTDAERLGLPATRIAENQLRPASALVERLWSMAPSSLAVPRPVEHRVVGTCRHFALLACAMLRARGIAARARCGFATYFQAGRALDHWIVEYQGGERWVRIDPEILGGDVLDHADDLAPGEFLTGGEAWQAYRRGEVDASTFGVHGTSNFGPSEIRGNLVRDLAALNKVEMLPWDEWGQMTNAYAGQTGPDYDMLLDEVAAACTTDDSAAITALFRHRDLAVPDELVR